MSEMLELLAALGLLLAVIYQGRRISNLEQSIECMTGNCDHAEEWTEDEL